MHPVTPAVPGVSLMLKFPPHAETLKLTVPAVSAVKLLHDGFVVPSHLDVELINIAGIAIFVAIPYSVIFALLFSPTAEKLVNTELLRILISSLKFNPLPLIGLRNFISPNVKFKKLTIAPEAPNE